MTETNTLYSLPPRLSLVIGLLILFIVVCLLVPFIFFKKIISVKSGKGYDRDRNKLWGH